MNRSDFIAGLSGLHQDRCSLLISKGDDYADADVLANFKRMSLLSAAFDINPSRSAADCALFLMLLKIDRWCNLRKKGNDPKNESVQDTVKDLHNYIDLAFACEQEKK